MITEGRYTRKYLFCFTRKNFSINVRLSRKYKKSLFFITRLQLRYNVNLDKLIHIGPKRNFLASFSSTNTRPTWILMDMRKQKQTDSAKGQFQPPLKILFWNVYYLYIYYIQVKEKLMEIPIIILCNIAFSFTLIDLIW